MREMWEPAIDAEYQRGSYGYGWGFLGTPEASLSTAKVCFVGLNPGGGGPDDRYDYKGIWANSSGNVYYDNTNWGDSDVPSPIQKQVQAWHELLGVSQDQTLCAQFVPFRSPSWARLPSRNEAIEFAMLLWEAVLEASPATLFITMGKQPAYYLSTLLHASQVARLRVGWGMQTIDVWDSKEGRRVVGMPHPSRFALFGRGQNASDEAVASFHAAIGSVLV